MKLYLFAAAFFLLCLPAKADRPVTEQERMQINAALSEIGCTATDMEFDTGDNRFEVDDATCGDQRTFDFELNTAFEIVDGDRPVTEQEQALIDAALAAEGCTGGLAEFDYDDNRYEVDRADCGGVLYEFDLDRDFNIVSKERDD